MVGIGGALNAFGSVDGESVGLVVGGIKMG